MKINSARLMDELHKIGSVGKSELGINRTAFSRDYKIGLELLKNEMEDLGLAVRVDAVGNLFGRKAGVGNNKKLIMVGSHLDTVVNGGLYDGALGIAAAMECIKSMKDYNIELQSDIEVVAFNAEACELLGGAFGSKVAIGGNITNSDKLCGNFQQFGLRKEDLLLSKIDYPINNYIELHIEQGDKLFNAKKQIGIVEGIVGITRYQVTVIGMASHAGTKSMKDRHDSLVRASELISFINSYAKRMDEPFVATVGKILNSPNAVNMIPCKTTFTVEVRDINKADIISFDSAFRNQANLIDDCEIKIDILSDDSAVMLDEEIQESLEKLCRANKLSFNRMYSGAKHDVSEMAKSVPAALIFVPSKDGITYSPEEYTLDEDIRNGCQLLFEYILKFDNYM